jgi:hypothetical protein
MVEEQYWFPLTKTTITSIGYGELLTTSFSPGGSICAILALRVERTTDNFEFLTFPDEANDQSENNHSENDHGESS